MKILKSISFVLPFLFIFSLNSHAELQTTKTVLDNGMTVLVTEMPKSPVVSFRALIKAGSATEGKFLGTGISHYLEHMLFKGTEKRGVGQIASEIQSLGGSVNAHTSFDSTVIEIDMPYDRFDQGLDIISDLMMHSRMDGKEAESERTVIHGEMRLREDDPDSKLSELQFKTIYTQHPYQYPIIGYKDLFDRISADDIKEYYKTYYIPNNIVFSIAGRLDTNQSLERIKNAFQDFKRERYPQRLLNQEPAQIFRRDAELSYVTDAARFSFSFLTVPLIDPDLYALDVLAQVLGFGDQSRLTKELYLKQQLVKKIYASHFTPIDRGFFDISGYCDYEKIPAIERAIRQEIEKIKTGKVDVAELRKAKRLVLRNHIIGQETANGVASTRAYDEAFTNDYAFSQKYVDGVRAVTANDVKRVAQKYLVFDRVNRVVLHPTQATTASTLTPAVAHDNPIRRHVLNNGVTILLHEDHTIPMISTRVAFNGGIRVETLAKSGLSQFFEQIWPRGTTSRNNDQITNLNESLALEFGGFSGKNSFGLSFKCLTEDFTTAIDLVEDVLKHPTFPETEIEKIRQDSLFGLQLKKDNISWQTSQTAKKLLFGNHQLSFDDSGTEETIKSFSRQDLIDYYTHFVGADNMVISVYGDIKPDETLAVLTKKFSSLKKLANPIVTKSPDPLTTQQRQDLVLDKTQAMIMISFQGPNLKSEDRYPVELMASILGSSFSGRLFNSIRDQFGQAYTLGGSYNPAYDGGIIYFYVLTTKANAPKVLELVNAQIKKITTEPVGKLELDNMKTYLKGEFRASLETETSRGFVNALDELYGLGFDNNTKYETTIDAITPEQIQQVAQKYLNLNQSATVVTLPKGSGDFKQP